MSRKDNSLDKLHIIDSKNNINIFDVDTKYIIPLYQRSFAWEDKQLIQLIEDILDVSENMYYYIGSLIVANQNNQYEVVDGQQRLTSLYLLLNCLGIKTQNTLVFACRDKSNYTLNRIQEIIHEYNNKFEIDRTEPGILRGIKIIQEELIRQRIDKDVFIKKLSKVILYRIEVPEHTDLNRYFEIMNTRGEQLEQHDILKARLMGYLPKEEQSLFATIWDACSDMTGYVQMHIISKNNQLRKNLFGDNWNDMPSSEWKDYLNATTPKEDDASFEGKDALIKDIINYDFEVFQEDGFNDDDVRVRFESIIEFPYFLIHSLKVLIHIESITRIDQNTDVIGELLDDKKLIEYFETVLDYGCISGKRISENRADFSRRFIICLLRLRYLFDKYIIKRQYTNDNSDGEWSLRSLFVSGQQSKKKPYYRNTSFISTGEWAITNDRRTKNSIMIQSALRVSYTSPKVMHWITKLLVWLSENKCQNTSDERISGYTSYIENIVQKAVREDFFNRCPDNSYILGVDTPHIVFNYLDYLLWSQNSNKYSDFEFEFRNSVEHWYPRNPSEGTFDTWTDGVDSFGNLCIIQRNVNSKFSNLSPEAKKTTFDKMISKGSLKLRIMSEKTYKHDKMSASVYWREVKCIEHEKEMISLLKKACGILKE